ncbi:MAG: hypothetical protein VX460_05610 [Planctomycetota bacterium]|nr:hypothetical protein [Planctomycetota bacterium]
MSSGGAARRGFAAGWLAVLLAAAGLLTFQRGLEARAEAEPPGLVAGAGLLPGGDAEVRTPGSLALMAPPVRGLGAGRRRAGAALMAAALALAAAGRRRERAASRLLRWLWVALGGAGLWLLLARASAGAPSAAAAGDGFRSGALLFALGLVLALRWGRAGRAPAEG